VDHFRCLLLDVLAGLWGNENLLGLAHKELCLLLIEKVEVVLSLLK